MKPVTCPLHSTVRGDTTLTDGVHRCATRPSRVWQQPTCALLARRSFYPLFFLTSGNICADVRALNDDVITFRPCPRTKWKVLASVVFQLTVAYNVRNASWGVLLFFTYLVSGTINHMMTLAVHELSHNLGFKTRQYNR